MRRLPASVGFFVFTAILFILQVIPWTGIFLMIVAAPLWSIATINAGFVGIGLEALLGRVSRLWLLAPALWFGGYLGAALVSERAFVSLDTEIRAENATRSVPFDPARQALVFLSEPDHLGSAASTVLQAYRLPVAYTEFRPVERRRNEVPSVRPHFNAVRIGPPEVCQRLRGNKALMAAGASGHAIGASGRRKPGAGPNLCEFLVPEAPILPVVRVEAMAEKLDGFLLKGKIVHLTITTPEGRKTVVRSGQAAPLMRWPMPAMGCVLNSGAPSWNCFFDFMRASPQGFGGDGAWGKATIEVVAKALRLEASPAATRRDELAATDTSALDRVLVRHTEATLANLDQLIKDPQLQVTVHDFAGLIERPDLLVPRAERMLDAMSAALVHGKGRSESARNLQRLLAALPEADFQRIAPDLVRRLDEGRLSLRTNTRANEGEWIDEQTLVRLGDAGAVALPVLERMAFTGRSNSRAYAVLGLCRMGKDAAALTPRLVEKARDTAPVGEDYRAAIYVALMRWGRDDLAREVLEAGGERVQKDYARRWPGLVAGGPADTCTLRRQR